MTIQHIEVLATIDPKGTHIARLGDSLDAYVREYAGFFYHVTQCALGSGKFDIENIKHVVACHYGYDVDDFSEKYGTEIIDGRWCSGDADPDLDPLLKFSADTPELKLEAYLYDYSFAAWCINGKWYCPRID